MKNRKQMYIDILENIAKKQRYGNEVSILYSKEKCFIVDKKYEKLCEFIMKKYRKILEKDGKDFSKKIIYSCASSLLVLINLFISFSQEVEACNSLNRPSVMENSELFLVEETEKYAKEEIDKIRQVLLEIEQKIAKEILYDSYLEEYSNYFHLDSEKVISLARITTNDYEDFTKIIPDYDYDLTNPKGACVLFVYHVSRDDLIMDLSTFGLTKEELITTEEIEKTPHDDIYELRLKNGAMYCEFYGEMCDIFGINSKELALAASIIEISPKGSYSSNNRNNVRGMRAHSGEWMTFPTLEAGIISACGNWKKGYNQYSIETIEELACYHISGKKVLPSIDENDDAETKEMKKAIYNEIMRWKDSVSNYYYEICENYDFYFSPTEENDEMILGLTK